MLEREMGTTSAFGLGALRAAHCWENWRLSQNFVDNMLANMG